VKTLPVKGFITHSATQRPMSSSRVVKIDFFTNETLPQRLAEAAKAKGAKLGKGLIAVKTIIASPPEYDFISIGNKPEDVQAFMEELAKQDGVELGATVQRAFREE